MSARHHRADPQAWTGASLKVVNTPIKMSRAPVAQGGAARRASTLWGSSTNGLSAERTEELISAGVMATEPALSRARGTSKSCNSRALGSHFVVVTGLRCATCRKALTMRCAVRHIRLRRLTATFTEGTPPTRRGRSPTRSRREFHVLVSASPRRRVVPLESTAWCPQGAWPSIPATGAPPGGDRFSARQLVGTQVAAVRDRLRTRAFPPTLACNRNADGRR